jgi:hypothetical protein
MSVVGVAVLVCAVSTVAHLPPMVQAVEAVVL